MKLLKYFLPFVIIIGISNYTFAQDEDDRHDKELNDRDLQSLRTFVNEKRSIDLEEKAQNLTISGDVRTEWRHINERFLGRSLRGGHAKDCKCIPLSHNDFDIECNLRFDYSAEKAWAYAHLQYDNSAGIDRVDCSCVANDCEDSEENCARSSRSRLGCTRNFFHGSGTCDSICLKRAYIGYDLYTDCNGSLELEIGRQMLYDVFESEIEFNNRMDGIVLWYESKWEHVADWYVQVAGFLVDERTNHFAYAAEWAFFNIYDTGFDVKYSFIDWRKHGRDRCGTRDPRGFQFADSQGIITYHLDPETFSLPIEVYGAVLYNHLAPDAVRENDRRHSNRQRRWGYYAGVTFGEVEYEGDWSIDIQYQYVEKYAVAFDDQGGIGLGNVRDDCCGRFPTTGYKGWRLDGLYAFTDNLTLQTIIEWSKSIQRTRHSYSKVELEAVYAF